MNLKYSVLIATRNRPQKLGITLRSLVDSNIKPEQVIVVSSGDQIVDVINEYKKEIAITHLHIEGKGQIRQKMEGVKLILPTADWVAFLDDDVTLEPTAISNIFTTILNHEENSRLLGVGFSERNAPINSQGRLVEIVHTIFGISTTRKGVVLSNGQGNNYMNSDVLLETSWLNGASMWRKDVAKSYEIPFLAASYSACEDLIFSYQQSKKGLLIVDPTSQFTFQERAETPHGNLDFFSSSTYWRMYFVLTNSELSISAFLWAQIGRTIWFILSSHGSLREKLELSYSAFKILLDVYLLALKKVSPLAILEKRQNHT